jgi:hypothetical protein
MVNKGKQAERLNLLISDYLPAFLGQHLGTGTPTEFLNFGSVDIVPIVFCMRRPCMPNGNYLVSGSGDATAVASSRIHSGKLGLVRSSYLADIEPVTEALILS